MMFKLDFNFESILTGGGGGGGGGGVEWRLAQHRHRTLGRALGRALLDFVPTVAALEASEVHHTELRQMGRG